MGPNENSFVLQNTEMVWCKDSGLICRVFATQCHNRRLNADYDLRVVSDTIKRLYLAMRIAIILADVRCNERDRSLLCMEAGDEQSSN